MPPPPKGRGLEALLSRNRGQRLAVADRLRGGQDTPSCEVDAQGAVSAEAGEPIAARHQRGEQLVASLTTPRELLGVAHDGIDLNREFGAFGLFRRVGHAVGSDDAQLSEGEGGVKQGLEFVFHNLLFVTLLMFCLPTPIDYQNEDAL